MLVHLCEEPAGRSSSFKCWWPFWRLLSPAEGHHCIQGRVQKGVLELVFEGKARISFHFAVQFNLVTQSCLTLWDPMDCSRPGLPVHHRLPEFTQTHWVGDAIQLSHPLSSPSPAFNLSQHQGLFKWVSSSHQVAKVLSHKSCVTVVIPCIVALQAPVCEISQARILEWVAISFFRGSSWPRNRIRVSCIAGRFFTNWATGEAKRVCWCH